VFDAVSFDSDAEEVLSGNSTSSTRELRASRRDLERRIQICDTLLDLRNYEQHLMMEYFSSLLCTTPTEEARHVEERHDKIVRVDLTSRTDYAGYDETQAVDEETVVIASQAPPLAGPRGRQPERPLIRRPHLDGPGPTYNDPESEALIARARAMLPPKEEKPEDPLDAVERRARLMCGKPEVEDAAPPEEIDEEFDPLLARAKALSLHASRVAAELESQIAAVGRSAAPVEAAPAPAVVVSKEEEDLVARARALLSDAEPAPTPTRVEPVEDDDLDIDMDLIRRARALRGASQLARTESK